MAAPRVSVNQNTVLVDGAQKATWPFLRFLQAVNDATVDGARVVLPSYTVATLPSATQPAQLVFVSNGTSNKRLAVSDGTNWRFPDGNIVS